MVSYDFCTILQFTIKCNKYLKGHGNGKERNNRKKYAYETVRVSDFVKYLYIAFVFSAYLIVMNDQYFDITKTRHSVFIMGTVVFLLLYACVAFIEAYLNPNIKNDFQHMFEKKELLKHPAAWMMIFLVSHIISFALTYDKKSAFTGVNGRYMGFFTFMVLGIMFFALCFRVKTNEKLYMLFLVVTLFAYIVAIFQHMGNDFMHYRDEISKKDFHIFMSTFGNINIFASFIVMSPGCRFCSVCLYQADCLQIPGGECDFGRRNGNYDSEQ